jgi:hypothetical protein
MKAKIKITRLRDNGSQTIGEAVAIYGDNSIEFVTLEPSWIFNKSNVSCIPAGCYNAKKRHSSREGRHFQVLDVKDRSYILIHSGNYRKNTEGCILVGSRFQLLNSDQMVDVVNSRNTLSSLRDIMPSEFAVDISWHKQFQRFYGTGI